MINKMIFDLSDLKKFLLVGLKSALRIFENFQKSQKGRLLLSAFQRLYKKDCNVFIGRI